MNKRSRKKIIFVLGTRPEIIKLSPLLRYAVKHKKNFLVIHTGQHFSYEMDKVFFKDLNLPLPKYRLDAKAAFPATHAGQTARMLTQIEAILLKERSGIVVVQGDTNTVLAASLASSKVSGMQLAHVEAGLRSYDRQMPEEINRILCDSISDFLFTPTPAAKQILLSEGVPAKKIFMSGNTIVDAVYENVKRAQTIIHLRGIPKEYFLLTLHRQENVDNKIVLHQILEGLKKVYQKWKTPILFPIHPRTSTKLRHFHLSLPHGVQALKPLGFLEFLLLESRAKLLLSDSGGVQEEGCILRVPCVTLRTSTERPETVQVGANIIAGHNAQQIVNAAQKMLTRSRNWKNPFGDGRSAQRIWKILEEANQ